MSGALSVSVAAGVPIRSAVVNADKNGTRLLIAAPGEGSRIQVHGLYVGADGDGDVTFLSAATPLTGAIPLYDGQTGRTMCWPISPDPEAYWIRCADNEALNVVLTANCDLDGVIKYRIRATAEQ